MRTDRSLGSDGESPRLRGRGTHWPIGFDGPGTSYTTVLRERHRQSTQQAAALAVEGAVQSGAVSSDPEVDLSEEAPAIDLSDTGGPVQFTCGPFGF